MNIEIYTDGSCIGNPGPGGWAALIMFDGKEVDVRGNEFDTTNNRMEMMAIIKALTYLHEELGLSKEELQQTKITVFSDSNLIIQTFNQNWKRKKNVDLWEELDKLRAWLNITWQWVKAHSTNKHNNYVDDLAQKEARKLVD